MSATSGDGETPSAPPPPDRAGRPGSLADPLEYHAFVQSLWGPLRQKLAAELDDELQTDLARLTRLLHAMPRPVLEENRELFELAYSLIAADKPNRILLQSLVNDLFAVHSRQASALSQLILRLCGPTPLNAVLSALATIVAMSFAVMLGLAGSLELVRLAARGAAEPTGLHGLLHGAPSTQLMLMTHAAFFGSVVSIAMRINTFLMVATMTPFMIYVALVTRPLVAVLISMLVFTTLKSGLVAFHGLDLNAPNGSYLAWAIGFLCGFSERLAQHFVVGASDTIGDSPTTAAKPPARTGRDGS